MLKNLLSKMNDSQLPRYQVFLQEKKGLPYLDVGSVHAPDPEMALLNARDVFVRRPECAGLWVIPAEVIFSRTRQQLEAGLDAIPADTGQFASRTEMEAYIVACKSRPAGTQTLLGEVQAGSPAEALRLALDSFTITPTPFAWWVFPAHLVLSSDPAEADSFFAPALNKPFRLSTDFHTLTEMRRMKDAVDRGQQPVKSPIEDS